MELEHWRVQHNNLPDRPYRAIIVLNILELSIEIIIILILVDFELTTNLYRILI